MTTTLTKTELLTIIREAKRKLRYLKDREKRAAKRQKELVQLHAALQPKTKPVFNPDSHAAKRREKYLEANPDTIDK